MYQTIRLKKNEERRILAGHLWIYSNEIDTKVSPLNTFAEGEIVTIETASGRKLGIGYINPHTLLAARLLTRNCSTKIDLDFFVQRIQTALTFRDSIFTKPYYRLIYGEGDLLPGLIVDRYHDTLVVQLNTAGTEALKDIIVEALIQTINPRAILLRNDSSIRQTEGLENYIHPIYGEPANSITLEENGLFFNAPIVAGQKTGWFYDQRNNRAALKKYVKNKRVLDVFSYIGSFGINAAFYGASEITCIDASQFALDTLKENIALNNLQTPFNLIVADAFQALAELITNQEKFGVIILDPPGFIKRKKDYAAGFNAYLQIHKLALELLTDAGILITTSCSQHLTREDLFNVIRQAGLKTKRDLAIIEQLHQAEDHPIHPAIAETEYLKGAVVKIIKN